MSESHRRPGRWRGRRVDPHTLAGAYAMDAVTDDDRARFEQHLADCETCLAELRGMRETTARLAAAAEVRPRAALREQRAAVARVDYDDVTEAVETNLEHERVRRCLGSLTDLQREAVTLAYYQGYTYREVAGLLNVALGTIKTRIRDGLIRMRDCMGVTW